MGNRLWVLGVSILGEEVKVALFLPQTQPCPSYPAQCG